MKPKRNYRDSLFRRLFNNKKNLLSAYNAIKGTDYTDFDNIEINTLDGVFFNDLKNDISFKYNNQYIVLIEHQSIAIKQAIIFCKQNNIMKKFLSLNESEVYDMISVEWDWNEAKKIWLEEGEEKGFIEGLAKGRTEVYKKLLAAGLLTTEQLKEISKLSDDEIKVLQ